MSNIENVLGSHYADLIVGDDNFNDLRGNGGNDDLRGMGGDDDLRGGLGDDTLDGGAGTDIVNYEDSESAVTVNLADGVASGGEGDDILRNIEDIYGSRYDDILTGDGGGNRFVARAGDDTIDGGGGNDTISYEESTASVIVNLVIGTASGEGSDVLLSIESVHGSKFGDMLIGDSGDNELYGAGGDDVLVGGAGADSFVLSAGDDTITDFVVRDDFLSFWAFPSLTASDLTIARVGVGSDCEDEFFIF